HSLNLGEKTISQALLISQDSEPNEKRSIVAHRKLWKVIRRIERDEDARFAHARRTIGWKCPSQLCAQDLIWLILQGKDLGNGNSHHAIFLRHGIDRRENRYLGVGSERPEQKNVIAVLH